METTNVTENRLPSGEAPLLQTVPAGLYPCRRCGRVLPAGEFYTDRRTGLPDRYCKECRRALSRLRRKKAADASPAAPDKRLGRRGRLVITLVQDAPLRRALILQALQRVEENKRRKAEKRHREELEAFC